MRITPSSAGVWFTASRITGPWVIATSVPAVVYTIPPSSPLYYVTYVRIYETTPQVVYVGYTPGYLGTVVDAVRHDRLRHRIRVLAMDRHRLVPAAVHVRRRCRAGLQPVRRIHVRLRARARHRRVERALLAVLRRVLPPGLLGRLSVLRDRRAPTSTATGATRRIPARARGTPAAASPAPLQRQLLQPRTGTSRHVNAGRQYNAWTGNATRGYDRTINGAAGGSGNVARASNYNTYTGQRSTANAASLSGAGGSTYNRAGATTAGPEGNAHVGGGSTYNAKTGKTNTWGTASAGNNHYADVNGNVYKNTGDGWQQHSSSGWSNASGDNSWANRESQARSSGNDRFGGFSSSEAERFGGGGGFGGGDRGGGGAGFGGRRRIRRWRRLRGPLRRWRWISRWPAIAAARCRHWNRTTLCPCHRRLPRKKHSRRSRPAVTSQPTQEKTES